MDSGWHMYSENTLMLYQQRFTARFIFCEMATGDRLSVAQISHLLLCKIIIVAKIPRLVQRNT